MSDGEKDDLEALDEARGADEIAWLRAERRLFTARAALRAPSPPPFAAVLTEVRRERSMLRRRAAWVSLAAAAALIVGIAAAFRAPSAPEATAEPPPSFACSDDPRALALEAAAYATDRAIASAEDHYAACLVATPRSVSAGAAAACGISVETDVTCGPFGPLQDAVLESRTRGGSLE
jgi:hypothetical protein